MLDILDILQLYPPYGGPTSPPPPSPTPYGRCEITHEAVDGVSFSFASMEMTYATIGTEQLTWDATDTGNLEAT